MKLNKHHRAALLHNLKDHTDAKELESKCMAQISDGNTVLHHHEIAMWINDFVVQRINKALIENEIDF